jgi:hypothetical protein
LSGIELEIRICVKNKMQPGMAVHTLVPAIQEAETGGSLEPRSLRAAWPTKQEPGSKYICADSLVD